MVPIAAGRGWASWKSSISSRRAASVVSSSVLGDVKERDEKIWLRWASMYKNKSAKNSLTPPSRWNGCSACWPSLAAKKQRKLHVEVFGVDDFSTRCVSPNLFSDRHGAGGERLHVCERLRQPGASKVPGLPGHLNPCRKCRRWKRQRGRDDRTRVLVERLLSGALDHHRLAGIGPGGRHHRVSGISQSGTRGPEGSDCRQ